MSYGVDARGRQAYVDLITSVPYGTPSVRLSGQRSAHSATPQGIGQVTLPTVSDQTRVQLRARAFDEVEITATERHWGSFGTPFVLPISPDDGTT